VSVRINYRTDHRFIAERKGLGDPYNPESRWYTKEEWDATPPAQPGDAWVVRMWKAGDIPLDQLPFIGYDICCPTCRHVHGWTWALNCPSRRSYTITGTDGQQYTAWTCDHQQRDESCWTWTGHPDLGTLSASPSLHADPAHGGCGFHAVLTNGVLG
jgi:hypothetical protein